MLEIAEQEIDVEAALVGLVDDQRVVLTQPSIPLDLGQQRYRRSSALPDSPDRSCR